MDALEALAEGWVEHLRSADGGKPSGTRSYVYASGRRDCVREMALDLLFPGDRGDFGPDALERMRRGEEREAAIIARLMQIGPRCPVPFRVIEGQRRFEIKDRDGVVIIVGKLDARLDFGHGIRPITEVKSGEGVRNAKSLEDLDRSPWTRKYVDQLLAYLLAAEEPWGLFILDRPGLPAFLRVNLEDHLERAERFLVDARAAVDAAAGGELPPYATSPAVCRRCPHFGKSCTPALNFGAGARIIEDEHLIGLAERREATADAASEYRRADEELKEALRGIELGVLGPFAVTGRWQRRTSYEIPKEIKEQFKKTEEAGTFRLELERVLPQETAAPPEQKAAEAA